MLEERDKAGGLAPPARPSGRALALRLRRFFADDHRFGLCVSLRLAACEDLDITQTGHHELDGVAGLAALIFPGTRTDLADETEAGADLNSFFEDPEMGDLRALRQITIDLKRWNVKLNDEEMLNHAAGQRVFEEIEKIELDESSVPRVNWIVEVLKIVTEIGLKPRIWRSQNIFYLVTKGYRKGQWVFVNKEWQDAFERLAALLKVRLSV